MKNTHLTHIEDYMINYGNDGIKLAINLLNNIDTVTVKYDGAPSICIGIDPIDNRFFISTKSLFSKTNRLYKSEQEIDEHVSGGLNKKLKRGFAEFQKLNISEGVILQGDFLYDKEDIEMAEINRNSYLTFHPNTIVYAVPNKGELAKRIRQSNIGVVWHTVYRGYNLETMSANFNEKISDLYTNHETIMCLDHQMSNNNIPKLVIDAHEISDLLVDLLTATKTRTIRVNAAINKLIRTETFDPLKIIPEIKKELLNYYQSIVSERKSEKGKLIALNEYHDIEQKLKHISNEEWSIFVELYMLFTEKKHELLQTLNQHKPFHTFLKHKQDGYIPTTGEGFVISNNETVAKLIDRLQFSRANFSDQYIKGW